MIEILYSKIGEKMGISNLFNLSVINQRYRIVLYNSQSDKPRIIEEYGFASQARNRARSLSKYNDGLTYVVQLYLKDEKRTLLIGTTKNGNWIPAKYYKKDEDE
jgi:hypothetical protein